MQTSLAHLEERWRRDRDLLVLGALLVATTLAIVLVRPPRVFKSDLERELEAMAAERR